MSRPPRPWSAATRRDAEAGLTLVELTVTTVILGTVLVIMASAVLGLVAGVRRQTGLTDAQLSTRLAFEVMDKQIRYADAVTTPGTVAGDQWIEWRVPDPEIPVAQSSSQSRCFQWRASAGTGLLQYRAWVVPTSGAVAVPVWTTVGRGLVIGAQPVFTTAIAALRAAPFTLPSTGPSAGPPHPVVGVALAVTSNQPVGRSAAVTVFTALNSAAAPATVCQEVPRS